jgi:hypothetical protein
LPRCSAPPLRPRPRAPRTTPRPSASVPQVPPCRGLAGAEHRLSSFSSPPLRPLLLSLSLALHPTALQPTPELANGPSSQSHLCLSLLPCSLSFSYHALLSSSPRSSPPPSGRRTARNRRAAAESRSPSLSLSFPLLLTLFCSDRGGATDAAPWPPNTSARPRRSVQ